MDFLRVVREAWEGDDLGRPRRVLLIKLNRVKIRLRQWNKEVFGNVFDMVRETEESVRRQECCVENEQTEANLIELNSK